MFLSSARRFSVLTILVHLGAVLSAPFNGTLVPLATPAAPHFVAYSDQWVSGENGPPAPSVIQGFNVFALSFLLTSGPADQASEWVSIGSATRSSIKAQYNNAGIKLIVSAFGSTDAPTSAGQDPTKLANTMAAWVKSNNLDGIDVDYEDFNAVSAGTAVNWLVTFTTVLRQNLPQGQYIITHAPIAPWFSSTTGSPYLTVNSRVGNLIDWYNVQFYSQGSEYTTCTGLVTNSGGPYTKSSIFEIHSAGVTLNKIVMGKPATAGDATGFVNPSTLATCVQQAKNAGWSAGVMVWEYPDAAASWIKTVRSLSWPV
ncbi:glycoside hydrolase family 18 protein [Gautieria morchelliformis]|nr:glycoside hydrolase family 18 protein [Gautieria morchelliformis]